MRHSFVIRASSLVMLCMLLTGCEEKLATEYGRRATGKEGMSVNGTTVLANLFEQAGHQVYTRRALSPSMGKRAGTIVWFPDSFDPPSDEAIDWLNDWLAADPSHTLVYVGRDYDAAPMYWDAIVPGAPQNKAADLKRLQNEAIERRTNERKDLESDSCNWFSLDYDQPHRKIDTLSGPWAAGIDPRKDAIELDGRVDPDPSDTVEKLLSSGGDNLVWRLRPPQGGQMIVVSNGSFLLNYPLLNREHRKLAARLVAEAAPGSRVVFLESGEAGPAVFDEESDYVIPGGLGLFTTWPLGIVLLHAAGLGVVTCVCLWPIFGRPKNPKREALSDFGKHIDALGEMLELTGDHSYATIRVLQYQQAQRGEAVPPSALRGATAPQSGQSPGAGPAVASSGRRGTAPPRKPL